MTAQGHTKRRILLTSMRYGLWAQSALLVRGSSRRIMTLRFRPANIRVINRRDSSTAVICPVFQNQKDQLHPKTGRTGPGKTKLSNHSGLTVALHIRSKTSEQVGSADRPPH